MIRIFLMLVVVLGACMRAQGQTRVELRSSAVVPAGRAITLGDVAEVQGDDADALVGTQVAPEPRERFVEVDVESVRAALDRAGVRWGRTVLRGSACSVSVQGKVAGAARPQAEGPASGARTPEVVRFDGVGTVRMQLAMHLARTYGVDTSALRLAFEDRDRELLDSAVGSRRVEAHATNSASSARIGVRVYIFQGDRLVEQRTLSVDALVRRRVVSAVGVIARGEELGADRFSVSEQWLPPSAAAPCTPEEAAGQVARARINAGQVILRTHVEPPVVVEKGDLVEVHCLSGNVHLRASRARALERGRDGEFVAFQLEGSKKTFKARMSGRGTAVMVLNEPRVATTMDNTQEASR